MASPLSPNDIPIPDVASARPVTASARPVVLPQTYDPTGQALGRAAAYEQSAATAVATANTQFQSDMGSIAKTFETLSELRQKQEDQAFVDSYQLEYNKRAAAVTAEALNSADAAKPQFVSILDQKLSQAQADTLSAMRDSGKYSPSVNGLDLANHSAMSIRVSTARAAAIDAHNQRLAIILDSANNNITDISQTAGRTGDLTGGMARGMAVVNSLSGMVAPDKLITIKNTIRQQILTSTIDGWIERGEADKWRPILDRNRTYSGNDSIVAAAANKYGVDPAYLVATARAESSGNPVASAPVDPKTGQPASAASGLFGFTSDTGKAYGLPPDAKSATIQQQADAAARFTKDQQDVLTNGLGRKPSNGELYLAHFLGADSAVKVITADPHTPVSQIVSAKAVNANPTILGGNATVADVQDWAAAKMIVNGGGNAPVQAPPTVNLDAATKTLNLTPQEKALYDLHLKNLYGPGGVDSTGPDGQPQRSTLYQAVVEHGGKFYSIPTVWNGAILPVDQAVQQVTARGWDQFPSYATAQEADARYQQIHAYMDKDTATYFDQKAQAANGQGGPMQGQAPSDIGRFLSERDRVALLNKANEHERATLLDQERAIRLRNQQLKVQSDAAEDVLFKGIASRDPNVTAAKIINNPDLLPNARQRLVKLLEGEGPKDERTYGAGFYDLFQRIHADPGDPKRIVDAGDLYSHVGNGGDLTMAGLEKLRNEIAGRGTPEATAVSSMKQAVIESAKHQISGRNPLYGISDPKGEELFTKWLGLFWADYEGGLKAGKTPLQLLFPQSPDYIGKSVGNFVRKPAEFAADLAAAASGSTGAPSAAPAAAAPAPTSAAAYSKAADVVAAYHAGKLTYKQAGDILIANGWASVDQAPAPAPVVKPVSTEPSVPISR